MWSLFCRRWQRRQYLDRDLVGAIAKGGSTGAMASVGIEVED
jgi:hypothetical protein